MVVRPSYAPATEKDIGLIQAQDRQNRRTNYWLQVLPFVLENTLGHRLAMVNYSKRTGFIPDPKRPSPIRNFPRSHPEAGKPIVLRNKKEIQEFMDRTGRFEDSGMGSFTKGLVTFFYVATTSGLNNRFMLFDFDIIDLPETSFRPKIVKVVELLEKEGYTILPVFTGSSWHVWAKMPDDTPLGDYGGIGPPATGIVGKVVEVATKLKIDIRGTSAHVKGMVTVDYAVNRANSPLRFPLSLHHRTGLVAIPLSKDEIMPLDPKEDAHPEVVLTNLDKYKKRIQEFFTINKYKDGDVASFQAPVFEEQVAVLTTQRISQPTPKNIKLGDKLVLMSNVHWTSYDGEGWVEGTVDEVKNQGDEIWMLAGLVMEYSGPQEVAPNNPSIPGPYLQASFDGNSPLKGGRYINHGGIPFSIVRFAEVKDAPVFEEQVDLLDYVKYPRPIEWKDLIPGDVFRGDYTGTVKTGDYYYGLIIEREKDNFKLVFSSQMGNSPSLSAEQEDEIIKKLIADMYRIASNYQVEYSTQWRDMKLIRRVQIKKVPVFEEDVKIIDVTQIPRPTTWAELQVGDVFKGDYMPDAVPIEKGNYYFGLVTKVDKSSVGIVFSPRIRDEMPMTEDKIIKELVAGALKGTIVATHTHDMGLKRWRDLTLIKRGIVVGQAPVFEEQVSLLNRSALPRPIKWKELVTGDVFVGNWMASGAPDPEGDYYYGLVTEHDEDGDLRVVFSEKIESSMDEDEVIRGIVESGDFGTRQRPEDEAEWSSLRLVRRGLKFNKAPVFEEQIGILDTIHLPRPITWSELKVGDIIKATFVDNDVKYWGVVVEGPHLASSEFQILWGEEEEQMLNTLKSETDTRRTRPNYQLGSSWKKEKWKDISLIRQLSPEEKTQYTLKSPVFEEQVKILTEKNLPHPIKWEDMRPDDVIRAQYAGSKYWGIIGKSIIPEHEGDPPQFYAIWDITLKNLLQKYISFMKQKKKLEEADDRKWRKDQWSDLVLHHHLTDEDRKDLMQKGPLSGIAPEYEAPVFEEDVDILNVRHLPMPIEWKDLEVGDVIEATYVSNRTKYYGIVTQIISVNSLRVIWGDYLSMSYFSIKELVERKVAPEQMGTGWNKDQWEDIILTGKLSPEEKTKYTLKAPVFEEQVSSIMGDSEEMTHLQEKYNCIAPHIIMKATEAEPVDMVVVLNHIRDECFPEDPPGQLRKDHMELTIWAMKTLADDGLIRVGKKEGDKSGKLYVQTDVRAVQKKIAETKKEKEQKKAPVFEEQVSVLTIRDLKTFPPEIGDTVRVLKTAYYDGNWREASAEEVKKRHEFIIAGETALVSELSVNQGQNKDKTLVTIRFPNVISATGIKYKVERSGLLPIEWFEVVEKKKAPVFEEQVSTLTVKKKRIPRVGDKVRFLNSGYWDGDKWVEGLLDFLQASKTEWVEKDEVAKVTDVLLKHGGGFSLEDLVISVELITWPVVRSHIGRYRAMSQIPIAWVEVVETKESPPIRSKAQWRLFARNHPDLLKKWLKEHPTKYKNLPEKVDTKEAPPPPVFEEQVAVLITKFRKGPWTGEWSDLAVGDLLRMKEEDEESTFGVVVAKGPMERPEEPDKFVGTPGCIWIDPSYDDPLKARKESINGKMNIDEVSDFQKHQLWSDDDEFEVLERNLSIHKKVTDNKRAFPKFIPPEFPPCPPQEQKGKWTGDLEDLAVGDMLKDENEGDFLVVLATGERWNPNREEFDGDDGTVWGVWYRKKGEAEKIAVEGRSFEDDVTNWDSIQLEEDIAVKVVKRNIPIPEEIRRMFREKKSKPAKRPVAKPPLAPAPKKGRTKAGSIKEPKKDNPTKWKDIKAGDLVKDLPDRDYGVVLLVGKHDKEGQKNSIWAIWRATIDEAVEAFEDWEDTRDWRDTAYLDSSDYNDPDIALGVVKKGFAKMPISGAIKKRTAAAPVFEEQVRIISEKKTRYVLATGGLDGYIRLWEPLSGKELNAIEVGKQETVADVVWSPDTGTVMVSALTNSPEIQIWSVTWPTAKEHAVVDKMYNPRVTIFESNETISGLQWIPGTMMVMAYTTSGSVGIYNVTRDIIERRFNIVAGGIHQGQVLHSASASPDGTLIAVGGSVYDDHFLRVYDWRDCMVSIWSTEVADDIEDVSWSPDGKFIATAHFDKTINIWNVSDGSLVTSRGGAHAGIVDVVVWSPDGKLIASGSHDRTVSIWDSHLGAYALPIQLTENIMDMAWSPDQAYLAVATRDATVHVIDAMNWKVVSQIKSPSQVHWDNLVCLSWVPGTITSFYAPVFEEQVGLISDSEIELVDLWQLREGDLFEDMRGKDEKFDWEVEHFRDLRFGIVLSPMEEDWGKGWHVLWGRSPEGVIAKMMLSGNRGHVADNEYRDRKVFKILRRDIDIDDT